MRPALQPFALRAQMPLALSPQSPKSVIKIIPSFLDVPQFQKCLLIVYVYVCTFV